MQIATVDFESYWAPDYSLSKMSPLEYVLDPRFELQSCAIQVDDYPCDVFFGEANIRKALNALDWSTKGACAHNMSGFDAYILAYRLGIQPKMFFCTLAMARPMFERTVGLGLAKLVKHFDLGVKDNRVLIQTRGRRLADFTPQELEDMKTYNREDTKQSRALFKKLLPYYTSKELWQIDALTRMRIAPQFELDTPLLETAASIERDRKHKALIDLGRTIGVSWQDDKGGDRDAEAFEEEVRSQLASADKFSELLQRLGVETPTKPSPSTPDKMIPALAKTDEAFIALQEHDDPLVAAAARARLDVKSTLLETRIQKFLTAGSLADGKLPITVKYCGAVTTGRDSGEEYNPQNLPRIDPDRPKPSDALRRSLRAPKGMKVIVADQSGIELRVNHFLWKVKVSMALYQQNAKADLYKDFASARYKIALDEVNKNQRQMGKVAHLGLGFGAGPPTFQRFAKTQYGLVIPKEESELIVESWRTQYAEIPAGWRTCAAGVLNIARRVERPVDDWGLVHTCEEGFVLPSGRIIRYPDLRQEEEDGKWPDGRPRTSWFYGHGRFKARITGPKADENIVQALARDSIFDCAVDFYKLTGLRPALRVHDELVYVVPEGEADALLAELQGILRTPPRWWPDLVVYSEGDIADNYGDAK